MNQLHLLRLLIPTAKTTMKIFHPPKETSEIILKKVIPLYSTSLLHSDSPAPYQQASLEYQTQLELKSEAVGTETQEESDDLSLEKEPFAASSFHLKKNVLNQRVKSLQYEANAPCQDSITYQQLKAVDAYTISIFDGHGGPQLAEYSKEKINSFIDHYMKEHLELGSPSQDKDIGQLLKESLVWSYRKLEDTFFQIYEQHLKLGNKKIKSVGACGITAIVYNDRVYVGNSGDSMGMFILSEGGHLMRSQKTNERLSVNNRAQRERLREKWSDVDEDIISEQSGNSYYLKGRLQPTRTIGDYYLKKPEYYNGEGEFRGPYLSCEPDVNEFKLTDAHKYIVLASDGVWDVLSKNEVMNSMMNGKEIDLNKTCYDEEKSEEQGPFISNTLDCVLNRCCEITGKSVEEVRQMERGKRRNYHDDITLAVVSLENQL